MRKTVLSRKPKRLSVEDELKLNQRVARRLHKTMDETHKGKWVGLLGGEVIAMGVSAEEVTQTLMQKDPDPRRGSVFQLGKEARRKVIILSLREA